MKLKFILSLIAASFLSMECLAYDAQLEVPGITIPSGSIVDFRIDLVDNEETVAFDAEIDLPDGFTILPQEDNADRTQYTLNYTRNEKMTFDASYPYNNNDIRLILMTGDNSTIKGKTGWVVKLPMTTTVRPGTYEATVHLIHATYPTEDSYKEVDLPAVTVKIIVTEPEEIRYTDNQLFCKDIEINQGENAELKLLYSSKSEVYGYSAEVVLPALSAVDGEATFNSELTSIENFTNTFRRDDPAANKWIVSGEYGGKRNSPAPSGILEIATATLNTASLAPGEYEIKVTNQKLSNGDADYKPAEYIGKLIVKATSLTEKCSTPIISIKDNLLYVHSDTEGATYHTSIVARDHKDVVHGDEPVELVGQYLISTYATADGYLDSEPATATLIWNKTDGSVTGTDEIEIVIDRLILLQSSGDNITIAGIVAGETVVLYNLSGNILFQGKTEGESFTIPYSCTSGNIYIVKVGTSTHKYAF